MLFEAFLEKFVKYLVDGATNVYAVVIGGVSYCFDYLVDGDSRPFLDQSFGNNSKGGDDGFS